MKTLLYVVISVLAFVVLVTGVIGFAGSRLPRGHSASRSILLHKPVENVYSVIRDFASAPGWRSDVKRIVVGESSGGPLHFQEENNSGIVNYVLDEDIPNVRMVTRIMDTNLGYSGSWRFELSTENSGTRITITENGEVSNVFFRFMSKYIFGQTASIDTYLTCLANRFGKTVKPQ